ncbi:hypothetical protein Gotri_022291 [Gossypium trilobum]|uniref:Sucrase n=2 Tax=Gossypium TaxID=3633 RepID=A0A7J9DG07_9ROSI|nr:hypothetical protein [Gossypium trilobum]MBA0792320.1 hypothetical protein [Gossypium harknessii]
MSSSREREESLTFPTNPSSTSSPITVSDHLDRYLQDPSSHIGSASGSYSNEGPLAAETASPSNSDVEFGFSRPDFRQQSPISGTVQFYQRHVFLCYKSPSVWPPRIEAAEFDRLPRLLSAAVLARKADMIKETRLTICEGHDGTETSNGDVLIFPDMIRYRSIAAPLRRLTHFDVDTFVEEVLVKNGEWLPGTPEKLEGSFVFVCSHGSRDRRCGVCGPPLVSRFKEEIVLYGLQGRVSVSPCSHIGGHKYAGNVIIFGSNFNGEVTGHWYGYVTPDDVPTLLEWHIGKGEIIDALWRGQMGLSEEEQKKFQELRRLANGETTKEATQRQMDEMNITACQSQDNLASCCQRNSSSCCHDPPKSDIVDTDEGVAKLTPEKKKSGKKLISRINSGKGASVRKVCAKPTWFESWEREDTYAALAVVCAAASIAVAYSCYKQLS